MSKFCTSCGAQLEDGAKFCFKCGAKQEVQQAAKPQATESTEVTSQPIQQREKTQTENNFKQQTYTQTPPTTSNQEQNSAGHGGIMKYVAIFLVIIAAVVGYIAFSGNQSTSKQKGSDAQAALAVKAEELMNDYIRDQGTAETKYKNKKVNITGQVIYKTEFKNTQRFQIVVAHKSVGGRSYFVGLDFPQSMVETVNQKKIGDFVVAEGICEGIVKQDKPTDISVQVRVEKSGGK